MVSFTFQLDKGDRDTLYMIAEMQEITVPELTRRFLSEGITRAMDSDANEEETNKH